MELEPRHTARWQEWSNSVRTSPRKFFQRLVNRNAAIVDTVEKQTAKLSHQGAAPQEWRAKPRSFLIGEPHDFNGKWQSPAAEGLDQRNAHQHTKDPIVSACVRHSIEVRSNQKTRLILTSIGRIDTTQIAGAVHRNLHRRGLHPRPHRAMHFVHGWRQKGPQYLAWAFRDLRQSGAAAHHAIRTSARNGRE
jgi:hypothetical protein